MKTPIDAMLDAVSWRPVEVEEPDSGPALPRATHEGILEIPGMPPLRVYQLDDGRRVIEAGDLERFLGG